MSYRFRLKGWGIKMNKTLTIIFAAMTFVFCISILSLVFQTLGNDTSTKAAIISGILSMIGGGLGAVGAYLAANYQIKSEFHKRDQEKRIMSRPILNCSELQNVREDLSNIHYPINTILLSETNLGDASQDSHVPFYSISFVGNFNLLLHLHITLFMIEDDTKEYHIGSVTADTEIMLRIPTNLQCHGETYGKPKRVEVKYTTKENENIKYIYDNVDNKESYILVTGNKEELISTHHFGTGNWQLPGRYIRST